MQNEWLQGEKVPARSMFWKYVAKELTKLKWFSLLSQVPNSCVSSTPAHFSLYDFLWSMKSRLRLSAGPLKFHRKCLSPPLPALHHSIALSWSTTVPSSPGSSADYTLLFFFTLIFTSRLISPSETWSLEFLLFLKWPCLQHMLHIRVDTHSLDTALQITKHAATQTLAHLVNLLLIYLVLVFD